MKRLFLSLAFVACLSLTATVGAQNTKRAGQRGLSKELNLTEEQQQKMKSANEDFGAKMKELRAKTDLSKEDKQAKMKELREQHQASVKNVLTPEQQTKWKELQSKRGTKDNKRPMAMRGKKGQDMKMKAQRGNRMKDLNLTDDQKQKMKALNDEYRTKNKEMAQQHREALNKLYTPEQQAKMKEMREKRTENRKFAFHGKKGMRGKLDEVSAAKLKTLKENFDKEKKAVELSRIAPDAQKKKMSELRNNFRKERRQIITDARKVKAQDSKPIS